MTENKAVKTLVVIFIAALVLRILMIFVGYHGDLNNNISWAKITFERGLNGYYESGNWPFSAPNQPPLTILLFYFVQLTWNFLNNSFWFLNNNIGFFPSAFIWFWEKWGMIILIKLPSIIADLGIGWVILKYVSRISNIKYKLSKKVILVTCVWLFNPITWYNSAVWGQTDPIVNLLGLIAVISLVEKKFVKFGIFFTFSILFKGSLAIFIPLLITVALIQKYSVKQWIQTLVYSLMSVVVVSVWFHPGLDLFNWLINLYNQRILPGEIGYLSANAFNFWWLVDHGKTLDSALLYGLSLRTWGFISFITINIVLAIALIKKYNQEKVFLSLAMVGLAAFLFLTRMHERYMYPFFPFATIALFYYPKLKYALVILSITFLLNMFNLFWIPELPVIRSTLETSNLPQILSFVNLMTFVGLLFLLTSQVISSSFKTK